LIFVKFYHTDTDQVYFCRGVKF